MKYIAFYDTLEYSYERRSIGLSSVDVVEYMAEMLSEIDNVEIISPTRTLLTSGCFPGRRIRVRNKIELVQPPTVGVKTSLGRLLIVFYTRVWLFFYLLRHCKKSEKVIVYHSLSTMGVMTLIKKLKKIELLMEIREIYTDINKASAKQKRKELDYFTIADSYIFPTELLNRKLNPFGKPYAIATAIYKSEKNLQPKFKDGLIHVVYAGTFRIAKGGALMSVKLAEFLDENYHVHILGEGSQESEKMILDEIARVRKNSRVKISYDGVLRGKEFKDFLQKCHIGLSTQTPEGEYNDSSFPSKILTYLSNGLEVVSIKIPAVECSPVGAYVHYYKENKPEAAAAAVKMIEPSCAGKMQSVLDNLHVQLVEDVRKLLK